MQSERKPDITIGQAIRALSATTRAGVAFRRPVASQRSTLGRIAWPRKRRAGKTGQTSRGGPTRPAA